MELGGSVAGALMPYHSSSITPNKKIGTFHLQQEVVFLLYYYSRKKENFLFAWQLFSQRNTLTTQPVKSHCAVNKVSSNELFLYSSLSDLPFSSIKDHSAPLFSGLRSGLPLDHISRIVILCFSQINPFCWGNLAVYLFKDNDIRSAPPFPLKFLHPQSKDQIHSHLCFLLFF